MTRTSHHQQYDELTHCNHSFDFNLLWTDAWSCWPYPCRTPLRLLFAERAKALYPQMWLQWKSTRFAHIQPVTGASMIWSPKMSLKKWGKHLLGLHPTKYGLGMAKSQRSKRQLTYVRMQSSKTCGRLFGLNSKMILMISDMILPAMLGTQV